MIEEATGEIEPFDASEGLLTVQEVAALYRVDPHTAREWGRNYLARAGRRRMPAIRTPGGVLRFSRKYVREHRG